MKRFKNILLVFDEGARGEAALERAATLAKENKARLAVIEVIEDMPQLREARQFISLWRPLLLEDPHEIIIRERQKQLVQRIESIRQQGIQGDVLNQLEMEILGRLG
jgi:nucleotide-binding universal stress UspA family protein